MGFVSGGASGRLGVNYGHRLGHGLTLVLGPQVALGGTRRDSGLALASTYSLSASLRWELWAAENNALALRPLATGGWQRLNAYRQGEAPGATPRVAINVASGTANGMILIVASI